VKAVREEEVKLRVGVWFVKRYVLSRVMDEQSGESKKEEVLGYKNA